MKRFIRVIPAVALIIVLSFFIFTNTAISGGNLRQDGSMVGKKAPDFSLKGLDGKTVKLSSLKGKVVILDFWATWCPPCRAEIPDFIELQKQYGKKGLVIIGIALDKKDAVEKFVKSNKINYKVVIGDNEISGTYGGVEAIPTTFVIAKNQIIMKQYVGQTQKSVFEKDIKELF
jgi:peroxiredoxin